MQRKRKQSMKFNMVAKQLEAQGVDLENHQILVHSAEEKAYVLSGIYSKQGSTLLFNLENPELLKLKCRKVTDPKMQTNQGSSTSSSRRGQERRIATAIDLVARWQALRHNEGISMEQAASRLNTPKKTLDDYSRQLKLGVKNGFDFLFHRNSLMGILRHFNHSALPDPPRPAPALC